MSQHPTVLGINIIFGQLSLVLQSLKDEDLQLKSENLFGSSVGQHVRHIIDMFLRLELGYSTGTVNYEERERNAELEHNTVAALKALEAIYNQVNKEEINLLLQGQNPAGQFTVKTSYYRELQYCFEHAIHHMALIRGMLQSFPQVQLPTNFGVAFSTVEHRATQQ